MVTTSPRFHSDRAAGLVPVPMALALVSPGWFFNTVLYFLCDQPRVFGHRRTLFCIIDCTTAGCRDWPQTPWDRPDHHPRWRFPNEEYHQYRHGDTMHNRRNADRRPASRERGTATGLHDYHRLFPSDHPDDLANAAGCPCDRWNGTVTGDCGPGSEDRNTFKQQNNVKRHAVLEAALPMVSGRAKRLYTAGSKRNQNTGHGYSAASWSDRD